LLAPLAVTRSGEAATRETSFADTSRAASEAAPKFTVLRTGANATSRVRVGLIRFAGHGVPGDVTRRPAISGVVFGIDSD